MWGTDGAPAANIDGYCPLPLAAFGRSLSCGGVLSIAATCWILRPLRAEVRDKLRGQAIAAQGEIDELRA